MSTPQFDIRIDKSGKLSVKVSGASGEECLRLTDMLARIIGHEESRELTAEYYGPPSGVRVDTRNEGRARR